MALKVSDVSAFLLPLLTLNPQPTGSTLRKAQDESFPGTDFVRNASWQAGSCFRENDEQNASVLVSDQSLITG